jgi:hypothetical protein
MRLKQHAIILKGKEGEKIFRKIYNGPKVPYDKLKEESEAIKRQWKTEDNDRNVGTDFGGDNSIK